jgi:hypothetical protein
MNAINTFSFTTRAQYLEFVAEWKAQHAALIVSIRQAKLAIKASQRDNSNGIHAAYRTIRNLRDEIINSANLRTEAKVEANRQYHVEQAAQLVAVA